MIVFGSTLSPYVRKVMVFCAEKGLTPELQAAGLGRGGPEFEAASPFRKMPGFKDGDFLISTDPARCLAAELGPYGINVNCIAPGLILSSRAVAGGRNSAESRARNEPRIPLRRMGLPEDCAKVIGGGSGHTRVAGRETSACRDRRA